MLKKYISWQYDIFQYEYEGKEIIHFTSCELEFFRKYDVIGYSYYQYIYDNVICIDRNFDIAELKNEIVMKYTQIKTKALLSELNNTVKFIEELLKARSPEEFLRGYKQYYIFSSENKLEV